MRIAELSRVSGVPSATIKYYVREGLLPSGIRTHHNQVDYGTEHVKRLRLIRALVGIGGLSIETARELLTVLDAGELSSRDSLGAVFYTVGTRHTPVDENERQTATAEVEALLARRGWRIDERSPALLTLIDICATLRLLGHTDVVAAMDDYATAAESIATTDLELIRDERDIERMTETAIVGTILGDTLLSALRRLAQEHLSRRLLSGNETDR